MNNKFPTARVRQAVLLCTHYTCRRYALRSLPETAKRNLVSTSAPVVRCIMPFRDDDECQSWSHSLNSEQV